MEEKTMEMTTVATVDDQNDVVEVTVVEPTESNDNTLLGVAIGAGLFALGLGAVKGVKHLIRKHKEKKLAEEAEFYDDDFDDDFEDDDAFEEAPAEEESKEETSEEK